MWKWSFDKVTVYLCVCERELERKISSLSVCVSTELTKFHCFLLYTSLHIPSILLNLPLSFSSAAFSSIHLCAFPHGFTHFPRSPHSCLSHVSHTIRFIFYGPYLPFQNNIFLFTLMEVTTLVPVSGYSLWFCLGYDQQQRSCVNFKKT